LNICPVRGELFLWNIDV